MKKRVLCALAAALCSATSFAEGPNDWRINGFLSIGAAWSNVNYLQTGVEPLYISFIQKRPTFNKDSDVGLQFTKFLNDDVSFTVQLLAKMAFDDWDVNASWAFLKYEPNDHWQFRVGRIRTNPFMLSDYTDVAYAYPWIRPPQEVYSLVPSQYSNFAGADVKFKFQICERELSFTIFYGQTTSYLSFPIDPPVTLTFDTIDTWLDDLVSMNLKFGNEVFSVRAGYESTRVTLYPNAGTVMQGLNDFMNEQVVGFPFGIQFLHPGTTPGPLLGPEYINYFDGYNYRATFAGLGYQFDWCNIVSMGEVVKRGSQTPIEANAIGWYLMGGYRVKQLLPMITFARERVLYNKVRRFSGQVNANFQILTDSPENLNEIAQALIGTSHYYDGGAGDQTSVTYGLRWDVMDGVALKGEVSHVHPDFNGPGLFDVNPLKSVNIYSLALNASM